MTVKFLKLAFSCLHTAELTKRIPLDELSRELKVFYDANKNDQLIYTVILIGKVLVHYAGGSGSIPIGSNTHGFEEN